MTTLKTILGMSAIVMLVGCQVKPSDGPLTRLSGSEIKALFVGKTVESFNVISGSSSFTYYAANGQIQQERYWEERKGIWKVNNKDEICLSMEGKEFRCRGIYREGDKIYKYRLSDTGQLEKVIRYRQFIDGNTL
ncbi:hypothetical protein ACMXYO_06475 [Neptuniibacter sp. QD37_6]|uniref:hypothetical protein n=1 Tax=Neptuniibacter sp. QD37_6 TaxID=3398210 RepID=UPI0039F53975